MRPDKMACFSSMNWPRNASRANAVLPMLKWLSSKCHCLDFVRCRNVSSIVVAADAILPIKTRYDYLTMSKASHLFSLQAHETRILHFSSLRFDIAHVEAIVLLPLPMQLCSHFIQRMYMLFLLFLLMRCVQNSFFTY